MNVDNLFGAIRVLAHSLTQIQVDSVNAILEACSKYGIIDSRQIAYILATAYHEARLKPIEEVGKGAGYAYGKPINGHIYYGRGFCQITWLANYKEFADLLKVDLVNHPELALQPDYAAEIIVQGMKGGLFTGVSLRRYFSDTANDPLNARKIINGLDKSELIKGYYDVILKGAV